MAFRTGGTRNVTISGTITGESSAYPSGIGLGSPAVAQSAATSVGSFSGPVSSGGFTVIQTSDNLGSGGAIRNLATISLGCTDATSILTTITSGPIDLSGEFEITYTTETCIELTTGTPPWYLNVPCAPVVTYARFYERLIHGSTVATSLSVAGYSVSGSHVVGFPAEVGQGVTAQSSSTVGISTSVKIPGFYPGPADAAVNLSIGGLGSTSVAGGSDTDSGTQDGGFGIYSSTAGASSGNVYSTASASGRIAAIDAAASLDFAPDKSISLTASVLTASNETYPDTLTGSASGFPGTTTFSIPGTVSGTQKSATFSWRAGANSGGNGLSNFSPFSAAITSASLAANGEDLPAPDAEPPDYPRIGRLLIHGQSFAGIGLSHAATLTIAGAFPAAAASLTKTYSPEVPADSYPYLRLSVRSNGAANLPARVTIPPCSEGVASNETDVYAGAGTPTKSWDFKTGAAGEYVTVDLPLFAPDNISSATDSHDGQYPYPVRKSAYDGVWRIGSITVALTGSAGSNTIEVQSATLVRKGAISATWLPTWQHSVYNAAAPSLSPEWPAALQLGPDRQISESETTSSDYARRFLYAHADGQPILEEWDFGYTRTVGGVSGVVSYNFIVRSIQGLCDAINGNVTNYDSGGTSLGSVRLHPGWTATPGVAIPAAYVPSFDGDIPPAVPYYYNAGLPAVYLAGKGQIAMDGGLSVEGVPLYDQIDTFPGGPMTSVTAGAVLRGVVQGLLLTDAPADGSPDRKAAATGKTVTLTQQEDSPVGGTNETGTSRGTGISSSEGWYSSGNPAGRAGRTAHLATAASDGTADPTASYSGDTWFARRRHYTGFIVVPPSVGARSPRGLNTDRGGYYASVVVRGLPKRGRVQWRRTNGPQVPLPGGMPWSVTSYISTPGTDQGDAEPWAWYESRDGSVHVFYTRETYDPADTDPDAAPTETRIREAVSFDDGESWADAETETDGMASARHPHAMTEPGATGGTLRAWYVPGNPGDITDTTHGTITGTFQSAGMAAASSPFTFQEYLSGSLTPLIVQDDVFGLTYANEGQGRYNLVVMIKGEGEPANFHSSDDGRTFTRVAGTGGGTETP